MWLERRFSKNKNKYYYVVCFFDDETKKTTEHYIMIKYAEALINAGCKLKERQVTYVDVEGVN